MHAWTRWTAMGAVALVLGPGLGALSRAAAAGSTATDPALEEVVVTGTRVRRTDAETPSPVQVISRDEIEKSGLQNIADVIRSVSADNQGSLPTAFSAGFASGASGVSLRGLGLNSTLVLVNGRRMAPYGLADDGARTFVDLNTIPFEAVDHVDVVKDGASAIYGSDAVAGVINIVLKNDFQGASLSGNVGTAYADDGHEWRVAGSLGHGNLVSDRFNLYLTVEASRDAAINNADRPRWLGTTNLTPWGFWDMRDGAPNTFVYGLYAPGISVYRTSNPYGSVRDPNGAGPWVRTNLTSCPEVSTATGSCLADLTPYYQVQPELKRLNAFGKGTVEFSDTLQAYVELGYFESKMFALGPPGAIHDNGEFSPADPLNPITPAHAPVLPANHPDNPYGIPRSVRLLTTMLGGRDTSTDSQVTRLVSGLKGRVGGWNYDVGVGYIESKLHQVNTGFVDFPVLQQALNDGTFRFDPKLDSPALLAAISPPLVTDSKNSVTLADASLTGDIAHLPGGPLGLAVGAEYRREKSDHPENPLVTAGDIVGLGYSAYSGDRHVEAAYLELNAPLTAMVELNGAYRYDRYSDYGNSSTPKIGFKFKPVPQLVLRGTYSEAFRAPGPTESGRSASLGFTNIAIITLGDPGVKPETAKSYTFGVVAEPFTGNSLSVDYYRIERKHEITPADQATIVAGAPLLDPARANGVFPGATPNSFLYYDETGNLATISGPFSNLAKTTTAGLDVDWRQSLHLGDGNLLTIDLLWTHILKFERVTADGTVLDYAGTQGPYVLSAASGTPKDRGALEATWSSGKYSLSARINYVAGMKLIDHNGETLVDNGDGTFSTTTGEYFNFVANPAGVVCAVYYPNGQPFNGDCTSKSFTTLDLSGKLDWSDHLEVNASMRNVFNTIAPLNPYTYGGLNYNPSFTQDGAIGRYLRAGFRYKF
jgi:iron complex outermembrane receptor protein